MFTMMQKSHLGSFVLAWFPSTHAGDLHVWTEPSSVPLNFLNFTLPHFIGLCKTCFQMLKIGDDKHGLYQLTYHQSRQPCLGVICWLHGHGDGRVVTPWGRWSGSKWTVPCLPFQQEFDKIFTDCHPYVHSVYHPPQNRSFTQKFKSCADFPRDIYVYMCECFNCKNLTLCGKLAFGQHSDR